MTKIGFIRHGCTAWNKEGRAQGWTDVPLDEEGKAQAVRLAEWLVGESAASRNCGTHPIENYCALKPVIWDVLYSSDLLRARQTADTINQKLQKSTIHFDTRIREFGGGKVEGTTEAERVERWGKNWRDLDMAFETMEAVDERGNAFFDEVAQKHTGKNILMVSHGSFLKRMLRKLLPNQDMDVSLDNCSITVVENDTSGWEVVLHNYTRHLSDVLDRG